jgi:hypothetical protein
MITDVERIINNVWEDVISFVNNEIEPRKEYITSKYGNVVIGFFYCPNEKPLLIKYDNFLNTNLDNNKFTISNIKRLDTKEFIDISNFCLDTKMLNIRGIGGGPIITYNNEFLTIINSFIKKEISKDDVIFYMKNNMNTFTGNSFNNIEGVVLSENDKKYQLSIIDTIDKKEYDRSQYELLIKDFIKIWNEKELFKAIKIKSDSHTYTNIINDLFISYIKNTSIFATTSFDKDKLIPPGNGYIGDLNYNLINNDTIKTICKVNEVYKNVYRILYKALKQHKKFNNHLVLLNNEDIEEWNKIVDLIW